MFKLDNALLFFIQENWRTPFLDTMMPLITALGNGGIFWLVLTVLFLIRKKYRKIGIMMLCALILCLISGNLILKPMIRRIRPFDLLNYSPLLITPPKDFSFPSGHTMASFACAVVLYKNNRLIGIAALVLASLISFSRLYLFVHFPSDVVAGMALGIIWGVLSVNFCNKYISHNEK